MPVASVVVEIREGTHEGVLNSLARIRQVTVYGVKDNQVVVVLEGETLGFIEENIRVIHTIEGVAGVYPVFAAEDE